MSNVLKCFVKDSHLGLEISQLDTPVGMVAMYALYDDHYREVYRGNESDIIAFINGGKYIRNLYEGY